MGHFRLNELALNDAVDEDSYKKYDLSEAGKLTAILLKVGEKVTTNLLVTELDVQHHITKLEVMAKQDKNIKSLRGVDLQGLHAYAYGKMPPYTYRRATGEYNYAEFLIRFGKYIGDPEHYLDLGKDSDVDLKITNDFDSTTYWTDTELKYTIHEIFLPDQTPAEKGYVRSYEHSYWPAVSGSTVSKKLEPAAKVFRIQLRGEPDVTATTGNSATDCYQLLRELSVDFRNKKDVIIDSMEVRDLMYLLSIMHGGYWQSHGEGYIGASGRYIETHLGYRIGGTVLGDENVGAGDYFGTYVDGDESRMGVWAVGADRFSWSSIGILPFNCIQVPFDLGYPEVPLLDTEAQKPVYIRVKSNNSSGDIYLVVEELAQLR